MLLHIYSVCVLSHVQLFETPWIVAHQAPLTTGFSKARMLEWVAISSSRESSWPRDQTHVSCIGGWILYHWATWEDHASNYNGKISGTLTKANAGKDVMQDEPSFIADGNAKQYGHSGGQSGGF